MCSGHTPTSSHLKIPIRAVSLCLLQNHLHSIGSFPSVYNGIFPVTLFLSSLKKDPFFRLLFSLASLLCSHAQQVSCKKCCMFNCHHFLISHSLVNPLSWQAFTPPTPTELLLLRLPVTSGWLLPGSVPRDHLM